MATLHRSDKGKTHKSYNIDRSKFKPASVVPEHKQYTINEIKSILDGTCTYSTLMKLERQLKENSRVVTNKFLCMLDHSERINEVESVMKVHLFEYVLPKMISTYNENKNNNIYSFINKGCYCAFTNWLQCHSMYATRRKMAKLGIKFEGDMKESDIVDITKLQTQSFSDMLEEIMMSTDYGRHIANLHKLGQSNRT